MGPDTSQQEQLDAATEELSGSWIDFSSELSGDDGQSNIGSLFSNLQMTGPARENPTTLPPTETKSPTKVPTKSATTSPFGSTPVKTAKS